MTSNQSATEVNRSVSPSTWRTSLMGIDLQALRGLAHSSVRDIIKTVIIEDDWEKHDPGPMVAGPDAPPPAGATHIWPRDDQRIVQKIGTEDLRDILKTHTLRLDQVIVRDFRGGNGDPSPEPPAQLAKEILDGSNAAITSLHFRRDKKCYGAFEVVAQLSPVHHAVGTSMLREAELVVTKEPNAYWLDLALHAPNLSKLKLEQAGAPGALSIPHTAVLNISSLELMGTMFSEDQLLSLLKRVRRSLTSLTLISFALPNVSSWRSFFAHIATECPGLSFFNFRLLKIDIPESTNVKFEMAKDDIPEPARNGLELTIKGLKIRPVPQPRTTAVMYNGVHAADVLHVLAKTVVSWGYKGGTHEICTVRD